jgi:hypothetical protein
MMGVPPGGTPPIERVRPSLPLRFRVTPGRYLANSPTFPSAISANESVETTLLVHGEVGGGHVAGRRHLEGVEPDEFPGRARRAEIKVLPDESPGRHGDGLGLGGKAGVGRPHAHGARGHVGQAVRAGLVGCGPEPEGLDVDAGIREVDAGGRIIDPALDGAGAVGGSGRSGGEGKPGEKGG